LTFQGSQFAARAPGHFVQQTWLYQSAIQDADVLVTFFRKPPESPSHANKIIEPAEDDCIGMDGNMIGNQL